MRSVMKNWIKATLFDLKNEIHLSFLPPLLIYLAAGLSGLTTIAGTFYVKEYLSISAASLAGVSFWAGLPWALKMSFGHLVDVLWKWKAWLIYLGAGLVAISMLIMVMVIKAPEKATAIMPLVSWYITSIILSAFGMVIQDAVADAMSVEAVPQKDAGGKPLSEEKAKSLHTTMQTFGRIALISGLVIVGAINIFIFKGVEGWSSEAKQNLYANIYLMALIIPAISISGVILKAWLDQRNTAKTDHHQKAKQAQSSAAPAKEAEFNTLFLLGGVAVFVLVVLIGLLNIPFAQEIAFAGSMGIVIFLMKKLFKELRPEYARTLFGTAIVIFIFRAVPSPGPGLTWFEIDILGFDQQFLSVLTLITSLLTLIGMVVLRPLMASRSLTYIIILLSVFAGLLSLPNIGLYYGLHHVTSDMTNGIVDARFIAILDTAIESPLGQIAMIPMLAWIARHAPLHLKATFFAVMASFTNLALSASSLLTKYLNEIFIVTREIKNPETKLTETPADYSDLGLLLIIVALVTTLAPLLVIALIRRTQLKVAD